ncbi:hypothetical protein K7X08_022165 [Anisodus acutangulus]|uniref:Uncharacterized protein n=1 Tax=Anisodus acutangulus TaxID=402998 RepID=A0A9Q1L4M9_9SOLA|nr:hypothetical protein K7X08_022165 [Anisodus acutangulus]
MIDRKEESAPENGSRAAEGEDLVAMSKYIQDGQTETKKLKWYATANVILSSCSVNDSFWQLNGSEASKSGATAAPSVKRPRHEKNITTSWKRSQLWQDGGQ